MSVEPQTLSERWKNGVEATPRRCFSTSWALETKGNYMFVLSYHR